MVDEDSHKYRWIIMGFSVDIKSFFLEDFALSSVVTFHLEKNFPFSVLSVP